MRINLYLSEGELTFVRAKPKGYLRRLVRQEMAGEGRVARAVKGPTCAECGGLVLAGKCLVCGRKS